MKDYIKFPYADRLDRVIDEFKINWEVPQCFGAVDGCHVCTNISFEPFAR